MNNMLFLIGDPLSHSVSPTIHNTFSEYFNNNYIYELKQINKSEIKDFISFVKNEKIVGFNVTIPHKTEIIKYLDEISDDAKIIGAVNTVFLDNNKLIGYNTDVYGFKMGLKKDEIDVSNKIVAVLGAGGSAKAICHSLKSLGAKEILIFNRTVENAQNLCSEINFDKNTAKAYMLDEMQNIAKSIEIIVNTTSVGMHPNSLVAPITDLNQFTSLEAVCDIIYNPFETKLLNMAKNLNVKYQNGLYMLIYQASKAYEIWTGNEINNDLINLVYKKLFKILNK